MRLRDGAYYIIIIVIDLLNLITIAVQKVNCSCQWKQKEFLQKLEKESQLSLFPDLFWKPYKM